MMSLLVLFFVMAVLTDKKSESRRILRGIIWFAVGMYALKFILFTGFSLLPCIILFLVVGRIVVPFLKGFFSSFEKH